MNWIDADVPTDWITPAFLANVQTAALAAALPERVPRDHYSPPSLGQHLTFGLVGDLIDAVPDPDFLVGHPVILRAYRLLWRSHFAIAPKTLVASDGYSLTYVEGRIPLFPNAFLSITETANGSDLTIGALTSLYAVRLPDNHRTADILNAVTFALSLFPAEGLARLTSLHY